MELDSKIESLCRLRKILSYSMMVLWGVLLLLLSIGLLLHISDSDARRFLLSSTVYCGLSLGFLSLYAIRNDRSAVFFWLSFLVFIRIFGQWEIFYSEESLEHSWLFSVCLLMLFVLYLCLMFVMALYVHLMRRLAGGITDLDAKIDSLFHLRKTLSYFMLFCGLLSFGPMLIRDLFDIAVLDFDSLDVILVCFELIVLFALAINVMRQGKVLALFFLGWFSYDFLLKTAYRSLYEEGVWAPCWSAFIYFMIMFVACVFLIFVIARHLWLMRKARIRDEKLALQEA